MKGDQKIIDALNRVLGQELVAINQYFLHARMLQDQGVAKLGKLEYEASIDEMKHADELIKRILFLEGLPNLQKLGPLFVGTDTKSILECDLKLEHQNHQAIKDGIKAIKYFSDRKIKTNCTLIFSAGQALLAAKAGATYVSPFIGRLDDVSTDGIFLINEIREIYDNYAFETEILAASVRHTMHVINCAKIGADVMTGPLNAITGLLNHPLTDIGLKKFLDDYKKGN